MLCQAKEPVSVSALLASLLVKFPSMQQLAQRAFVTYLKSIFLQKDKDVFDVSKLPIEDFAVSLGLSVTPKLRFLKRKSNVHMSSTETTTEVEASDDKSKVHNINSQATVRSDDVEDDVLLPKESPSFEPEGDKAEYVMIFICVRCRFLVPQNLF